MNRRLRYYYKTRDRNWRMGLTHNGKPRQRRMRGTVLTPELRRARDRKRWHKLAAKYVARGLTSKGKPRVKNRLGRPANPHEIAWHQWKESNDITANVRSR